MVIDCDPVAKLKIAEFFLVCLLVILENFMVTKIFRYMVCGPVFNILSHPVTYIMYFITENEAPPPNVPLSGPPHQLSKSLLKYSKVMTLAVDSMHNQMT